MSREDEIREEMDLPDMEMLRLEAENRIRNLAWTLSGDYSWQVQPDVDLFLRSHARGIYQPICEGAFFRYYDRREFSLYLLKKLYYDADSVALSRVTKLCMDAAIWRQTTETRKGVLDLRRRAADDFLEQEFTSRSRSPFGRLELLYYGRILNPGITIDANTADILSWLDALGEEPLQENGVSNPMPVIAMADHLYNTLVDPQFEKRHGDLDHVLGLTLEELAEADFDWKDFLTEEAGTDSVPEPTDREDSGKVGGERTGRGGRIYELDDEKRKKTYAYMELNYGRSYMKELDQNRINHAVCRGIHEGCRLFYTDGILHGMVRKNYQSEYVRRQHGDNLTTYKRNTKLAARNIQLLADTLRQALIRRTEIDTVRSDTGEIQARELWKVGRTGDDRLFRKEIRQNGTDFVVDILMDASGSQGDRRGEVAVQGYIISEALSMVGIPHRVQSFCTCWDYTILQRFREYDDPREKNRNIFEFSTSANNRDGLAIKAVTYSLLKRPEENKILIVLSDGRPNDRVVNRSFTSNPQLYVGDVAVNDTAAEIRRARNNGIAVLGVFAGEEVDLGAEKRIFGRDFAYIRQIRNFAPVVGRYLRRQLDLT